MDLLRKMTYLSQRFSGIIFRLVGTLARSQRFLLFTVANPFAILISASYQIDLVTLYAGGHDRTHCRSYNLSILVHFTENYLESTLSRHFPHCFLIPLVSTVI